MSDKRATHLLEQTGTNIDLAFQLFNEVVADDEGFDAIPEGGTLVLLPYDNPKVTLQNLGTAYRLASTGASVYLRPVGTPPASSPGLYAHYAASFPLRRAGPEGFVGQLSIEYDPIANADVFDFSGGQHSTFRLPISSGIALLVDLGSQEAVGYSVPEELVEQLSMLPQEGLQSSDAKDQGPNVKGSAAIAAFIMDLALVA